MVARTGVAHCCGFWLRSAVRHEGWLVALRLDFRQHGSNLPLHHAVSRHVSVQEASLSQGGHDFELVSAGTKSFSPLREEKTARSESAG